MRDSHNESLIRSSFYSMIASPGFSTATGMPVRVEDVARDGSHTVLDIVSIVRGEGAADSLYRFDAKKYEQNGYYIARP